MTKEQIKQKAKEIAWQTSKHYDPNACKQEWCEMAAIDMACWLLSHQWVSVEDELPPRPAGGNCSERVIVRTELYAILTDCYDYKNGLWVCEFENDKVTHWMSIPPLAEEGGEK